MKAFVLSLAVFALLLTVILCNAAFVKRATEELNGQLDALTFADRREGAAALEAVWQKHRTRISFSVSFKDLSTFDRCVAELRRRVWEDEADFERAVVAARCAVQDLCRLERLCVENIF